MAVDKFETGKWYLFVGNKHQLYDKVQDIADGKPHKCIEVGERGFALFSHTTNERPFPGGLWKFNRNDFAEVEPPSQPPKSKNKYRPFTKDDIGKVFTVRQWDDMADEFDEHSENAIIIDTSHVIFDESMKSYCGKKITVSSIVDDKISLVRCKDNNGLTIKRIVWIPQMFEECIIKESKAGDTITMGITREGLKIMTASALKESIEKDMASIGQESHGNLMDRYGKMTHGFLSTPSQINWFKSDWTTGFYNQPLPSTVKGFPGLIEEMDNANITDLHKILKEGKISFGDEILPIQRHDLSIKSDKTKFNINLIKTKKLNFRMDR